MKQVKITRQTAAGLPALLVRCMTDGTRCYDKMLNAIYDKQSKRRYSELDILTGRSKVCCGG